MNKEFLEEVKPYLQLVNGSMRYVPETLSWAIQVPSPSGVYYYTVSFDENLSVEEFKAVLSSMMEYATDGRQS